MTSMPASRSARAMIFAPRSCPSSPGLATTTRILRSAMSATESMHRRRTFSVIAMSGWWIEQTIL